MRKNHSIAGTTILQRKLEDGGNTQFIDGMANPVTKLVVGLQDVSVFNIIVSHKP